jgi:hypothetical protein
MAGDTPESDRVRGAGLIAHGPQIRNRQLAGESRAGRPIGSQGRPLVRKVKWPRRNSRHQKGFLPYSQAEFSLEVHSWAICTHKYCLTLESSAK